MLYVAFTIAYFAIFGAILQRFAWPRQACMGPWQHAPPSGGLTFNISAASVCEVSPCGGGGLLAPTVSLPENPLSSLN